MAHRLLLSLRGDPLRDGLGLGNIYVKALNKVAMSGATTAHSVVEASSRGKWLAGGLVVLYALITMIPLVWIFLTGSSRCRTPSPIRPRSFSTRQWKATSTSSPPAPGRQRVHREPGAAPDLVRRDRAQAEHGHRRTVQVRRPLHQLDRHRLRLDLPGGFLGTLAAYGFSRFKVPLKDDLLFFILSTRMMPLIAVAILTT